MRDMYPEGIERLTFLDPRQTRSRADGGPVLAARLRGWRCVSGWQAGMHRLSRGRVGRCFFIGSCNQGGALGQPLRELNCEGRHDGGCGQVLRRGGEHAPLAVIIGR